ncbi:MAG: protein phosphatase 2C domain-containing protein [Chloroflexota bacterium]
MNRLRRLVKQSEARNEPEAGAGATAVPETANQEPVVEVSPVEQMAAGGAEQAVEDVSAEILPAEGLSDEPVEAIVPNESLEPAVAMEQAEPDVVDETVEAVVPDLDATEPSLVEADADVLEPALELDAEAAPAEAKDAEPNAEIELDMAAEPVDYEPAETDLLAGEEGQDADIEVEPFDAQPVDADAQVDAVEVSLGEDNEITAFTGLDTNSGPLVSSDAPTGVLSPNQVDKETSPLAQPAEVEELTALPINAVVDTRYVVQNLLHHSQDRNLYRVTTRKQQRCPVCGRVVSADLSDCPHCGSALDDQLPAEFYLMAESYRPDALMQDPSMMELNLYHPNLVPVIDFFSHKPFGHVRYYAVAEPRQGVRLSQLSLPRPGGQVLNWAMQLSDALDYLHSRGVVGAGAEADDILVQGDRASLASLQNARSNVDNQPELAEQQGMDLARLAGTMYEAYTGHTAAMSPEGTLPMPSTAPEQVGVAFRAAIEPVQGVAPPISAARWRDLLAAALEAVVELERPGRPVGFVSAGYTDVGRIREQNQDSFGMSEFTQASAERPIRMGLYVIADGMGGHKGGEIASALAVQAFCGEAMTRIMSSLVAAPGDRALPGNDAILQGLVRAVQSANERIYRARDNRQNDMGTTVVAVLIAGGKAYIVNVGDSRIYLYSRPRRAMENFGENGMGMASPVVKGTSPLAGTTPLKATGVLEAQAPPAASTDVITTPFDRNEYVLTQVSVDHSLVHRLVELGQLDAEEAKVHPHRNFIYRSVGGPPPLEVDTFVRTLHPGDRLLLCSDGLNSMIEDSDMEDVLSTIEDPAMASHRLIELANEAGGHDNITAIIVDVTEYLPLPEHPTALNNT